MSSIGNSIPAKGAPADAGGSTQGGGLSGAVGSAWDWIKNKFTVSVTTKHGTVGVGEEGVSVDWRLGETQYKVNPDGTTSIVYTEGGAKGAAPAVNWNLIIPIALIGYLLLKA